MTERKHKVLLVGHCGPDAHMLAAAVRRAAPGADVQAANDPQGLAAALAGASLVLVNRVLDAGFGGSGVDLIRSLANGGAEGSRLEAGVPTGRTEAGVPALLISNYDDAQREAEDAGALPGFGKRDVMSDVARQRIRAALGLEG